MSTAKKQLGHVVEVKEGGVVRRPDGVEVTVTGGSYVLAQVGVYDVDGTEMTVKADK